MRHLGNVLSLLLILTTIACAQTNADKKELARIAKLEKTQTATKKAHLAAPKNPARKGAYIKATLAVAEAYLNTPAVPPRAKYPKSLRFYREVRKVDPKNAEAKSKIELIEGIYRSMGRPVPPS